MRRSIAGFITFGALCTALFSLGQLQTARADITWTGDIDPADPTTWTSNTRGYIGKTSDGTLTVDGDSDLLSDFGYIGYGSGATGEVTVDGAGSTWTNSGYHLYVGYEGIGTLIVQNGGVVTTAGSLIVDPYNTGGKVVLDNGSITAQAVFAAEADLEGTGTIDAQGWCYDSDHVISQASDLQHQFVLDALPGQNVTVNVDLSTGAGRIGAGYAGTATLTVQNGVSLTSYRGYMGYQAGAVGTVTIEGAGTTWTDNGDYFHVGYLGTGTLNVLNQARLTTPGLACIIGAEIGSTGFVNVDGAGSTWTNNGYYLTIGNLGGGTLNITGGGAVTVEGATYVSRKSGSSGTIHFDNGTLKTSGLLCAFDDLTGTGTINTHGLVSDTGLVFDATHGLNQTFNINDNPGQNITVNLDVDGAGSMGAGFSGIGTMSISDGIVIESTFGYIGYKSGSTGEVTVDGTGSTWTNNGFLLVGADGVGALNITSGGAVSSEWGGSIGDSSGSTGEVTVDGAGSTWNNSGGLHVGNSGNGTLTIQNGGLVTVVYDAYIDNSSESEGTLSFGIGVDGPGLLDIEGELTIGDNSTLLATVDSGIDLVVGDEFTVITFGTISGTFTNEPVSTIAGDYLLDWAVNYNANDITLEVATSFLAADFDEDGNVDGADLLAWRTDFGTGIDATHTSGDADGDGDVDGNDFLRWQTQFGSGAGSGTLVNAAVPEPSVLVLLAIGAMGLLAYRRRIQ